jgi:hypothetical protein
MPNVPKIQRIAYDLLPVSLVMWVKNDDTQPAASATVFDGPGVVYWPGTEAASQVPIPAAGKIKNFRFRTKTAQPATGSLVVTMRHDGVDTAITVTVAANEGVGTKGDLVNSFTVKAGDLIGVKWVNNATSVGAGISGVSFEVSQL